MKDSRIWITCCILCFICAAGIAIFSPNIAAQVVMGLMGVICAGIAYKSQDEEDDPLGDPE